MAIRANGAYTGTAAPVIRGKAPDSRPCVKYLRLKRYPFMTVLLVTALFCVGCVGVGRKTPQKPKSDLLIALEEEYKEKLGHELLICCNYGVETNGEEDMIEVLKYALKNNKPFPNHRKRVEIEDVYIVRFGREAPHYQYTDDVCNGDARPDPIFGHVYYYHDTASCERTMYRYRVYLMYGALHKNEPLPENITVTRLDLWLGAYERLCGKESFPAWFQELSYEDKIKHLDFATENWNPYLSKEEEDSIKAALEQAIFEKEKILDVK